MKKSPVSVDSLRALSARVPQTALISGAVVLVLLIAGVLWMNSPSDNGGGAAAVDPAYERLAGELAEVVVGVLQPYQSAVAEIAANANIVRALSDGGGDIDFTALAAEQLPALDDVLALRILPPATRDPQTDATPPLSFASISMLRKARNEGKNQPAEVHLAGNEQEHLVMLARIEAEIGDGPIPDLIGFVHLSISPNIVRQALASAPSSDAYVEIRQGPAVTIAASGVKPAGDTPSAAMNVEGTRLAVVYRTPGRAVEADASGGMLPLLTVLLLAGAAVAGGWFFLSQRGTGVTVGALPNDTVIFVGALKAILDGAHPGLEQLITGEVLDSPDISLDTLGAGAEGEDVTTIQSGNAAVEDPTVPRTAEEETPGAAPDENAGAPPVEIPASIFRAYDIRGIVDDTLTEDGVYQIGRALGAEADARGQKTLVVARDGRHSSEALLASLTKGLLESGRDVLDIGLTPTPVLYFATHYLDAHSGIMITGSHNPAEYNGLKIVLDGEALSGEAIKALWHRIENQDFVAGDGSMQSAEIVPDYIRRISEDIPVTLGNALKVVVDCGNGVPGIVAPAILRAIGHDVVELYCDVDGDFPNHHPDPSQPENLQDLIDTVADEGADLGLAFDGDGDRLGVVDGEGNIIWPDRQMILFARDVLARNAGAKIIFDVKCTRLLSAEITASGGEPIMSQTGHSLIKAKMQESGALLAGEMSGHIFFKERWYGFDDAIYAAARLLEILINSAESPAEIFAALPGAVATPELRLDMPEEAHADFMQQILAAANFDNAEISTIDGLRVDFSDSWGLIRPSNTTPCLVLRFEGDDEAALETVKGQFRELLTGIDAGLSLPF